MSSIYRNLSEEVKLVEKEKYRMPLMEKLPQDNFSAPRFTGLKVAVSVAFLLSLAAFGGAVFFYQALNSETRKREALEVVQIQVQERALALEEAAEQYRTEIDRMREQLATYGRERRELQQQIEEGQSLIAELQNKILEVERRNKTIEEQLAKAPASSAPVSLPEPADSLLPLPEPAREEIPLKVSPQTAPKTPKVLTVNRRFNFVVVNLGLQDQVKIGDDLEIERDGKVIGSVKVEKLYDSFSAAAIVKEPKEAPIQEGDILRRPA